MSDELGGVPIRAPNAADARLAMLLWGDAGCGKTTLAATAPGIKLLLLFDPDGDMSIATRNDVRAFNFSAEPPNRVVLKFRDADPLGIEFYLKAHPEIESVIFDSATAFAYMALQEAVSSLSSKKQNSSMEQPGQHGYTWANVNVIRAVSSLIAITGRLKRNIIIITHEGRPDTSTEGHILNIPMALSKSPANQLGARLNEMWHMSDTGKEHRIAVRPCRNRTAMKTRMWNATQEEFTWRYDPMTHTGEGLAKWFAAWKEGGGKKLPLPK